MKTITTLMFLTFMLLCAALLHAASKKTKVIKIEKVGNEVTQVQTKKEIQIVPSVFLL